MRFTHFLLPLAALLPLAFTSCNSDPEQGDEPVLLTRMTLRPTRNAEGINVIPNFAKTDEVKLVDVTTGSSDVKSPMNPGTTTSQFVFEIPGTNAGDLLVGIYPAHLPVEFEGKKLSFTLPSSQNGKEVTVPYVGWVNHSGDSYSGNALQLEAKTALIRTSLQRGSYSIVKAVLKTNGGENVAGKVTVDTEKGTFSATTPEVTVNLSIPLDCRMQAQSVPFFVAPCDIASGVTVTFYTDDGRQLEARIAEAIRLTPGKVFDTDPASVGRQLVAAGSTKVYLFDENAAREAKNYKAGLIWEWDSKSAGKISKPDHIDDAKPVYGNTKFLVTSSFGWCGLVDIATKELEFYASGVTNAHSAEILPNDRIAVACSDGGGGDCVALFDKSSNARIASYSLSSAHGVVWCDKTKRLYAIGGSVLQVYKVNEAWDTSPALILEKEISSSGFVSGMHDMTAVDDHTLLIGGNKLAFFDIDTERFTAVPAYNAVAGFKSVNYNPTTGEMYYTYGFGSYGEGDFTWSSHWIRYTDNIKGAFTPSLDAQGVIRVEDINMYKVRVFNW